MKISLLRIILGVMGVLLLGFILAFVLTLPKLSKLIIRNSSNYPIENLTVHYNRQPSDVLGSLDAHSSVRKKLDLVGETSISISYVFQNKLFLSKEDYVESQNYRVTCIIDEHGNAKIDTTTFLIFK